MQERAGRRIGSMNHVVAIHACPSDCIGVRIDHTGTDQTALQTRSPLAVRRLTVVGPVMTLVAQERRTRFQQRRDIRAMRGMTVGAILVNRLVFPQKRTALLGVTGEAGFGDGGLLDQLRSARSVRIVAVGAGHLADVEGVRRNLLGLRALLLMAGVADLRLR